MFCHACGKAVEAGDPFCRSCGAAQKAPEGDGGSAPVQEPSTPAETPLAPPRATDQPTTVAAASPKPDRPGLLQNPMLLGIIAVLGLGAAIFGGIQLMSGGDDDVITTDANGDDEEAPVVPSVGPESPAPTTAASPGASPQPTLVAGATQSCTNIARGYTLEFPDDWFTNTSPERRACRFFSDEPIPASDFPETAIGADFTDTTYQEILEVLDDPSLFVKDSENDTTVGGHTAVVMDLHASEAEDELIRAYIIDVDGEAFVMQAQSEYATDYEAAKTVLDAMAATITFQ